MNVHVASPFREARTDHADFALVRAGRSLESANLAEGHRYDHVKPVIHASRDLRFQARKVTPTRDCGKPSAHVGRGIAFVHVLAGRAFHRHGLQHLITSEDDSLSVDAEPNNGFVEALTPEFVFLAVQAERPQAIMHGT